MCLCTWKELVKFSISCCNSMEMSELPASATVSTGGTTGLVALSASVWTGTCCIGSASRCADCTGFSTGGAAGSRFGLDFLRFMTTEFYCKPGAPLQVVHWCEDKKEIIAKIHRVAKPRRLQKAEARVQMIWLCASMGGGERNS